MLPLTVLLCLMRRMARLMMMSEVRMEMKLMIRTRKRDDTLCTILCSLSPAYLPGNIKGIIGFITNVGRQKAEGRNLLTEFSNCFISHIAIHNTYFDNVSNLIKLKEVTTADLKT